MANKFYYTSTDLINSIKRRILFPISQSTFSEQDILDFATEEMNMAIVPVVLQKQEDYYLYTEDITLVNGTSKYNIPYRAIGNKIREVSLVDASGTLYEMTRVGVGDLPNYPTNYSARLNIFYIQNNQICVIANSAAINLTGNFFRVSYYLRPNSMVPNAEIANVVSVNAATGEITVDAIPAGFSALTLNSSLLKLDFIKSTSPHKLLSYDIQIVALNSTTKIITIAAANIPSELAMNDIVALATQTNIPQIPSDLHVLLAQRVSARILESIGDTEGLTNANAKIAELEQKTEVLIGNRVDDAPKIINNAKSLLRVGALRRRIWR